MILALVISLATKGEKKKKTKKKTLIIARAHFFFALEIAFDVEMLVGSHEKC